MKRLRLVLIVLLLLIVAAVVVCWCENRRGNEFMPQIQTAAHRYGIDPLLVKAIVWRESNFRPQMRGRAGEIGLMQIQEIAAREWAEAEHIHNFQHEHCFDPGTNTLAATFYYAKLLKRHTSEDNPIPYALADYNAGRGNSLKWSGGGGATNSAVFISQIGFRSTKKYVRTTLRRYAFYKFFERLGVKS